MSSRHSNCIQYFRYHFVCVLLSWNGKYWTKYNLFEKRLERLHFYMRNHSLFYFIFPIPRIDSIQFGTFFTSNSSKELSITYFILFFLCVCFFFLFEIHFHRNIFFVFSVSHKIKITWIFRVNGETRWEKKKQQKSQFSFKKKFKPNHSFH